ncbi:N/A [soil metagenome]
MTTNSSIIRVDDVSKRFALHKDKSIRERLINIGRGSSRREEFWALRNVSLDIATGSTVGLVGHNGSGKSTLLKVIGGILQPTSGTVLRRGRMAALLELGAGFHADLTGRENVFLNAAILGLTRLETERVFDEIVAFSGIEEFIDTQVKFYSSGMYVRLAFSVAVHVDPDLLLVDEVLAVGDEPFQKKCMDKIAEFQQEGRTIVLVSHSAEQVGGLADRVVVLDGGVVKHDGDTAEGLRVLRQGFDAGRESVVDDNSGELVRGARIEGVEVIPSAVAKNGMVSRGADLDVVIDYRIVDAPAEWIAGIAIETPLGQALYRVNTSGLRMELPRADGAYRLNFTIPGQQFGGGQYLVNVGLATSTGESLDRRRPGATFFVDTDPVGAGVMQLATVATVAARS